MRVLFLLIALIALVRAAPEPVDYCSAPQTPWQVYTCEQLATRIAPPCVPQRRAPASGAPIAGVAILFHGYTACPSGYTLYADQLQQRNYLVLSFLNPGHGRVYNDCSGTGADCRGGYPVELLPIKASQYAAFVERANSIAVDEWKRLGNASLPVVLSGHSLGGAMVRFVVFYFHFVYYF